MWFPGRNDIDTFGILLSAGFVCLLCVVLLTVQFAGGGEELSMLPYQAEFNFTYEPVDDPHATVGNATLSGVDGYLRIRVQFSEPEPASNVVLSGDFDTTLYGSTAVASYEQWGSWNRENRIHTVTRRPDEPESLARGDYAVVPVGSAHYVCLTYRNRNITHYPENYPLAHHSGPDRDGDPVDC